MSQEIFVPYGATVKQETREEQLERVKGYVKHLHFFRVQFEGNNVDLEHGYVIARNDYYETKSVRNFINSYQYACPEIVDEVVREFERDYVQAELDRIAEKKRLEEEKKAAEHAKYIAEQKATYDRWQAEAKEIGITFKELCEMKHAECVKDYNDDWDDGWD